MASFDPREYMNRAYSNITAKDNRAMVISTAVVGVLAFAAMVTSAYTADHINHSSCDKSKDPALASAYKWAWVTAVIAGLTTAGMVAVLIKTGIDKGKLTTPDLISM